MYSLCLRKKTVVVGLNNLAISRYTIYELRGSAVKHLNSVQPPRKTVSGAPKKTVPKTDKTLKLEVMSNHSITSVQLKNKHPDLL